MKRKFRFMLPVVFLSMALTGCDFITIKDDNETSQTDPTKDPFYKDYNLKAKGSVLVNELQKLCFDKHKNYVAYSQIASYYKTSGDRNSTEAIKAGSGINQYFYSGKEVYGYTSNSNADYVGNREHVWPCAKSAGLWVHSGSGAHYVDGTNYFGGGSDLFHIRACEKTTNTRRGDSFFVDFSDSEFDSIRGSVVTKNFDGGPWDTKFQGEESTSIGIQYSRCEPHDKMKGDVARILLYVWVHYGDRGIAPEGSYTIGNLTVKFSEMTSGLKLSHIMGYTDEDKCKEVLKRWNKLDPVSDVEKLRNDTVQKIQGNRNMFVDYPFLVDQL